MIQFKTLTKSDPEFASYLLGTFSQTERALPMQSLNVATHHETVTFKIVPVDEIQSPSALSKWAQILKLQNVPLWLFPIFLLIVKNKVNGLLFNPWLACTSVGGAFFLFVALSLRNDCRDHLSGLDRIHPQNGNRALQNGWITVMQAQHVAHIFLGLAVLLGLPAIVFSPQVLLPLLIVAAVAFLTLHNAALGLKYRWWTEFAVFLLLGPLLTVCFDMAIGVNFNAQSLLIGVLSGWLAVYIVHLKNYAAIMANDQAGFANSIAYFGFEKGRRFLLLWWLGLMFLTLLYHWIYTQVAWQMGFMVVTIGLSLLMRQNLLLVRSPVASNFFPILQRLHTIALIFIAVWIVESLGYLLVLELGSG